MDIKIWHNPRCSKSRQTLQLIQEKNLEPTIIRYLENPPNREELEEVLGKLNMEPRDLMRKREKEYKALNLANPELTRAELIDAMVENPRLIERPIVIKEGKVALGRPPEQVLDIL
ncbi:arsenate reductase (glutaredoxin) [Magnetococcales bacterium HHB-1]